MSEPIIAVVGASGVVGRQVVQGLLMRDHPADHVRAFASERGAGEELDFGDDSIVIEKYGDDSLRGANVVIVAAPPEVARPVAERAQALGLWVVDLSGSFRVDDKVPLVVPGVNDGVLDRPFPGRIVSLAHASTQAFTRALEPLRAAFGLLFADATVLCGSAVYGSPGVAQLSKQTAELMNAKDPDLEVFPHRLGFNVIPSVGAIEGGLSQQERALLIETARVWGGEKMPAVTTTSVLVPTYHGFTLVLSAHLARRADADGVRAVLKADSGLKLLYEPAENIYPMPMLATDDATVHVGRVRVLGERVQLVAAIDNAFRTADAALDIAFELADRD
ncbi:MAG: aspartate-semialdehyde dehydrogenase [Myxococcus sp.]|nr:aspartate-semialdehyde dehydrogenase [Myxococcus sp.]